jgi:hypothetical protein
MLAASEVIPALLDQVDIIFLGITPKGETSV